MAWDRKRFEYGTTSLIRDIRPMYVRLGDWLQRPGSALAVCAVGAASLHFMPGTLVFADLILLCYLLFFWWLKTRDRTLPAKLPADSPFLDKHNMGPGKSGQPEGILFLGNEQKTGEEIWFSNGDARTHVLYLGTTGSGKTEGLKSMAANALSWGSGFVYIDGKADTDLWSSVSSLVRRHGRDDDLLVLNYMTGNSDERAPSNTMNPFSSGSASYLSQMLISLMPEAEGDNAMWKERAVSLMMSLMPALTWKRDNQEYPLSVNTIRECLNLDKIIQLSKDEAIPERIRQGLVGYLDTLPGYVADAFDDEGKEKPMGPDSPMVDTTTVRQQHGYLTMQFTRALQSLGDDYGYIFDAKAADIDMVDIVLNRRIVIVLIPALEKSGDETANLGKIVAATLKGMMGSTLGANLEGESAKVIENRPTHSSTPFMCIFDEVGYYTAPGMAVMAAQARSLGFSLVFAAQDLQSMEKRVKEEARSITANCNIKIFGKLQDPTQTKEFFENHIGKGWAAKVGGFKLSGDVGTGSYIDSQESSMELHARSDYDDLVEMKEGEAVVSFEREVIMANIFYSNPGHAKAMRVSRYVPLPQPDEHVIKHAAQITKLRDKLAGKTWTAMNCDVAAEVPVELETLEEGLQKGKIALDDPVEQGISALGALHALQHPEDAAAGQGESAMDTIAEAAQTPPPAPEAQPPNTPMGYFGKEGDAAVTDKPVEPLPSEPQSWDKLVQESEPGAAQQAADATAAQVQEVKKQLAEDVERVLKDAGANMRNSIFKDGGK